MKKFELEVIESPQQKLVIVFICRHARHRAVAASNAAKTIWEDKFYIVGPTHWAKSTWGNICQGFNCEECSDGNLRKKTAVKIIKGCYEALDSH